MKYDCSVSTAYRDCTSCVLGLVKFTGGIVLTQEQQRYVTFLFHLYEWMLSMSVYIDITVLQNLLHPTGAKYILWRYVTVYRRYRRIFSDWIYF
jgi:hypothetical protein